MIVIADSSALVALSACQCLPVLEQLFGEVKVPEAVFGEVCVPRRSGYARKRREKRTLPF